MSKQILITGGAGFVGSHLADGLLRAGHTVRVLDDLTPQVHPAGVPDYLSRKVEILRGDVRDPRRMKEALDGIDFVFHFAATVGVGQSMYEISRYMSVNTQGTAELLQAILDSKRPPEKIIVASSMSIYGEGRYSCSQCGKSALPPVRSTEQLRSGAWNLHCDACGGTLKPVPTDETKPSEINSVYALSKRDQANPARADLPAGGRHLVQRPEGYRYTIKSGQVTFEDGQHTVDIHNDMSKAKLGTKEFADAVIERLGQEPSTYRVINYAPLKDGASIARHASQSAAVSGPRVLGPCRT